MADVQAARRRFNDRFAPASHRWARVWATNLVDEVEAQANAE
jgi:hypothetical protein